MSNLTILIISMLTCPVIAIITFRLFDVLKEKALRRQEIKDFQEWLDINPIHEISKSVTVLNSGDL